MKATTPVILHQENKFLKSDTHFKFWYPICALLAAITLLHQGAPVGSVSAEDLVKAAMNNGLSALCAGSVGALMFVIVPVTVTFFGAEACKDKFGWFKN